MNPDALLCQDMSTLHRRLERDGLATLRRLFRERLAGRHPKAGPLRSAEALGIWLDVLQNEVDQAIERIDRLRGLQAEFEARYAHAATADEKRFHVIEFARAMGASRAGLRADRRAFRRWFGRDAVLDRCRRRIGETERYVHFCLDRLERILVQHLEQIPEPERGRALRGRRLETLIEPLLVYTGDARLRTAALQALHGPLELLPRHERAACLPLSVLHFVERAAVDASQDTWLQLACLGLLVRLDPVAFLQAAERRIQEPAELDADLFVRAGIVRMACTRATGTDAATLLQAALRDHAPFVRRTLACHLAPLPLALRQGLAVHLLHEDPEPSVRRNALRALAEGAFAEAEAWAGQQLCRALRAEQDELTLRAAMSALLACHRRLVAHHAEQAAALRATAWSVLARLHAEAASPRVRRWSAELREGLWCESTPQRRALHERLDAFARRIPPGGAAALPRRLLRGADPQEARRVLARIAHHDHPLSLSGGALRGWRLHRGFRFRFRLWRLLHELRHPATDKRQAFPHWIGRVYYGRDRFPSARLAELTPTRVPGEPLYLAEEDGWRPYLPLPDDILSALDESLLARRVTYWTAEGRTELILPRSPWRRLRIRATLTARFAAFAELRNFDEARGIPRDAYARALARLGIELRHHPYDEPPPWHSDATVRRSFHAWVPLLPPGSLDRVRDYFFSLYENTFTELAWFVGAVAALFFGAHTAANHRLRRARRALALVMGGWGTRGKSGTERLKAALFNALGFAVVSKTTGTEAMFLHAHRFGPLVELPLFRPYGKATIWEQSSLVVQARDLGTDVFLWECMALTPAYVRVMQQDWMRDDLATITNTYPDHEDLQGPAGINIPQVMTEFIPPRATLVTSEEQMLPILRAAAESRGTHTRAVDWLDIATLTPDVLARFPYEEHPANVALVLGVAREFGIDEDFALKEMADRVVPDIGVLKIFPQAPVRLRRLRFVNGMAANERVGFLENWRRTGFAEEQAHPTPGTWLMTFVNNREDRVARSQAFARILVQDVAADLHLVVGTNIDGFLNYVEEAWREWVQHFSLFGHAEEPLAVFRQHAHRLRVATDAQALGTRIRAMLTGLGVPPPNDPGDTEAARSLLQDRLGAEEAEEAMRWLNRWHRELAAYRETEAEIARLLDDQEAANRRAARALWDWLSQRLVPVRDPHMDGESLVALTLRHTPPGFRGLIMGCQNIKGPGLEFVYRWQEWETCEQACRFLREGDEQELVSGLQTLAALPDYGLLCRETLDRALATAKTREEAQNEYAESQILLIEERLKSARERAPAEGEEAIPGWLDRALAVVESFLDAGDAVRRRRRADLVYRELAAERIGLARAVSELKALNRRQKGGWLRRRILGERG
ncbi:MAG TPA: hypothetical protein ENK62_04055 [Chromatiales bacterium]|nr:hypothetical protein [Chromatiales bacterium]